MWIKEILGVPTPFFANKEDVLQLWCHRILTEKRAGLAEKLKKGRGYDESPDSA